MSRAALVDLEAHEWGSAPDFYGPRHDYREALMLRRLLPTMPGPRVLNAGCGAGSLTLRLADLGLHVTSVDASDQFVERLVAIVAERYPGRGLPVDRGDLHALPYPDGAFDAVVCGEVLEHLDDDRRAIGEIARVLAPGGVLVASVPANPWRYDWFDLWAGHRRRYTTAGLGVRLAGAGFAEVQVTPWGFPFTGLFHRHVFMRMLRRRLESGSAGPGRPPAWARAAFPVVRAALEVDTLFQGRMPGWFGHIAWARTPPPRAR
ncbi:MAG: class I SAM-dependent methyltransferase [Thermoleophilia bacterium]|nr:class I SAM-dependent methyltransferase [Thermoleophilia bacterium]